MFRYFSWIVAFVVWMMLCFLPDLFCQFRYTAGRREALREYYGKMKHPGRKDCQNSPYRYRLDRGECRTDVSLRIYTLGMINGKRISIGSIIP